MPIEPPQLDDLRYDGVVEDLVRRIPVYAPSWTDHNESDPGITLIQLFAQLAEQIGYRLNRVPELAHIELLKLLGIRLRPAEAATTRLALLLQDPSRATSVALPAGTVARAKSGKPPPVFTTDGEHDVVPADVALLVSSKNPFIHDVLLLPGGAREDPSELPGTPLDDSAWLSVRWDGRKPKAKDLPASPVGPLGAGHRYLWLGLRFNDAADAGFRGVRVRLDLQFDDDEQPTLLSQGVCEQPVLAGEAPDVVDWLHYWDADAGELRRVPGRIDDDTDELEHSGSIVFTVPEGIGPVPDDSWAPMQEASSTSALDCSRAFSDALAEALGESSLLDETLAAIGEIYKTQFLAALEDVWAGLPPAPAIQTLVDSLRDGLIERIDDLWTLPDLAAVSQAVETGLVDYLRAADSLAETQPLFAQLDAIFLQPVRNILGGGGTLAQKIAAITSAVAAVSANASAAAIHDAVISWIEARLAAAATFEVPNWLRQDVADYYADLAMDAINAVWGSPLSESLLEAIADYYKGAATEALDTALDTPPTQALTHLADVYAEALGAAREALEEAAAAIVELVVHPLDPKHRRPDRIRGWLRLTVPGSWADDAAAAPRLRHAGFNVVPATNAEMSGRYVLGGASGRPGQHFALRHQNLLADTLRLSVQESTDPTEALTPWEEAADLAAAGPFDRVFALDREAGIVDFGDGINGAIPPLVPGAGNIVVESYRYGGGEGGNLAVGAIDKLEAGPASVAGAVNVVVADGGKDAEDLDGAKRRARRDLATRHRAVTKSDFEWIATQTPGVRVARAVAVGRRRPLPAGPGAPAQPPEARCGPPLPAGPTGLDDDVVAHGVVTVVAVPDTEGPEPLPTPSFLRAVCLWLDRHRLVTTELYVVPPQYARICDLRVTVRPQPGFTRTELQDAVEADMARYLHVLAGGDDGTGFPFGGRLHVAELLSRIDRLPGVDRVEDLRCSFTRTKSGAVPRQGTLVLCPSGPGEVEELVLAAEESVSFDAPTTLLTSLGSP